MTTKEEIKDDIRYLLKEEYIAGLEKAIKLMGIMPGPAGIHRIRVLIQMLAKDLKK